jgi:DNA-binding LacI/PurR family transcriptional regulator
VVYLDRPVTKPAHEHYSVSDRRAGYSAAMEHGGLKPVVLEAPHWGWHLRKMTEQVAWAKQIMSDPSDRPTAVVARSRNAAQWFMRGAELAGARVPSDLSLIGFDKHPKTQTLEMEIGSLVLPLGPMGHELARMVFEKIDAGGRRLPSVVMPLAINYGDTVAPPDRSPN